MLPSEPFLYLSLEYGFAKFSEAGLVLLLASLFPTLRRFDLMFEHPNTGYTDKLVKTGDQRSNTI